MGCKPTYATPSYRITFIITIVETNYFPGLSCISGWLHLYKPKFLVSSTYLITLSNFQNTAGFAPSFAFNSSVVTLTNSGLECFTRNKYISTLNSLLVLCRIFFIINHRLKNQKYWHTLCFMTPYLFDLIAKFYFPALIERELSLPSSLFSP